MQMTARWLCSSNGALRKITLDTHFQ